MKADPLPIFPKTPADRELCRRNVKTGRMITPFQYRVYELCSQIPSGSYTTYKEMSDFLKSSPRAVGQALRNNPFAPTVPCHRVLASNHFVGGFDGQWGEGVKVDKKMLLLTDEGLVFANDGRLDTSMRRLRLFRDFTPVI